MIILIQNFLLQNQRCLTNIIMKNNITCSDKRFSWCWLFYFFELLLRLALETLSKALLAHIHQAPTSFHLSFVDFMDSFLVQ